MNNGLQRLDYKQSLLFDKIFTIFSLIFLSCGSDFAEKGGLLVAYTRIYEW